MAKNSRFWVIFLLLRGAWLFGQDLTADQVQLQQMLLAHPPVAIVKLSEKLAARGRPNMIDVPLVLNADLDGSGAFKYFLGLFTIKDEPGGFLRVFKEQGSDLIVVGDQDASRAVGGWGEQMELVDVNNDGIPEIKVTSMSHDARDEYFSLFSWTGSSLHDMVGRVVGNGALEDIDGDGIMEIVTDNPSGKGFDIFKLSGNTYQFFKTVPQDPSGLTGANGKINYVRAFCRALEPQRFTLREIHEAIAGKRTESEHEGRENVHLTFGGLQRVNAGPVTVDQVDTSTVVVSPHLIPIRASVHPAHGEDRGRDADRDEDKDSNEICEKDRGRISVELARTEFLRGLQKLQPTGPLAVGDQIEIRLTAKLKDGSPVSAIFKAEIVGDHNRDDREKEKDHKDKPGS